MKNPIFTGAAVAIVTPMNADGSVNYDELKKMIDFQIDNGTDAIVICGTTGESSTLTDEEHVNVIKCCIDHTAVRVPVIAGTGSNDTEYAISLSKEACELGADALLLVTPYYNKTSQRGLIAHYTAIADAVDKPIILYNVPSRTGVNILPETLKELSKHPRINGVKEASGNISQVMKIHALCGEDLNIWSGNDDQITSILACGGIGVISVLSNVLPQETHDIVQTYLDGNAFESTKLMAKYLELANALFCDVNPIPVKEALNQMGFQAGPCRLPLYETSDANKKYLTDVLKKYDLVK